MPELPEVETIRRDLDSALKGSVIKELVVDKSNLVRGSVADFKKVLTGAKFTEVRRRAKLLTFVLDKAGREVCVVAHLKMTGRFLLRKTGVPKDQYQHVTFIIERPSSAKATGGPALWELRFCDLRQFGYLQIVTKDELKQIIEAYGPEPLDDLTEKEFAKRVRRNVPIKPLLLDQKVFSGIGNIYANEALFRAKILPSRKAVSLSSTEVSKLYAAVNQVITLGIKNRGTTTRDESFRDIYNNPGTNSKNLKVYEQTGALCSNKCGGRIGKMMLGGRGTYFCPVCQV